MKFKFIKKAAVFGLDARIKKLCHTGLDPVSHALNNKYGAMFGLDARIALAIFGALSVISGAALYSAIQSATAVKWQVYFNELTKATEAYYLDNGKKLPTTASSTGLYSVDLLSNRENLATWNGPYWQGEPYGVAHIKDSTIMSEFSTTYNGIHLRQGDSWSGHPNFETCLVNDINCYQWIFLNSSGADKAKLLKIFNLLDEKIDNGDGASAGLIRMYSSLSVILYYKSNQYTRRS